MIKTLENRVLESKTHRIINSAASLYKQAKNNLKSIAYAAVVGAVLTAGAYTAKVKAGETFDPNNIQVYTTLEKSASYAVYEAINQEIADHTKDPNNPNDPLFEDNFTVHVSGECTGFSSKFNNYWPEQDLSAWKYLDPNLVSNYNLTINGNSKYFPLTHYVENNKGKLTFVSCGFSAGSQEHNFIIENSSVYLAFIGFGLEDIDDIKDSNFLPNPPLPTSNCGFYMSTKSAIYYNGEKGANLIIAGCDIAPFKDINGIAADGIELHNIPKGARNQIKRNVFKKCKTGVLVRGEAGAKSGSAGLDETPPVLEIYNCNFIGINKQGIGVDFNEPLSETTGGVRNCVFKDLYMGIADCNNSGKMLLADNNFEIDSVIIPHQGQPIRDHFVQAGFVEGSDKIIDPNSRMIDLGKNVGMSFIGWTPDIGMYESAVGGCAERDIYPENGDGIIDLKDFSVFADTWLNNDHESLARFLDCWLAEKP